MRRDDSYLLDMLAAARQAARFAENMTYAAFERSDLHQNAIFKTLEVVGEAASRVSEATRESHTGIPWREIVGLRNRIVHAYFDIDIEVVWRIVQEDLPALIAQLEDLVPSEEE